MPVSEDSGLRRAMDSAKKNPWNSLMHLTSGVGVPTLLFFIWMNVTPVAVEKKITAVEQRVDSTEKENNSIELQQAVFQAGLNAKFDALLKKEGIPIPQQPADPVTIKFRVAPGSDLPPWYSGDTLFIPQIDSTLGQRRDTDSTR